MNYSAKLEKCPKDFENGKIMLKLNNEREDKLPQMLWAVCKNGKFKLSIKNHTDKELHSVPHNSNSLISNYCLF